ncbi:hypothetical protein AVEN_5521-1 [Araneus ventricosus]|uniref:Uncharacterized protein n=1 Tax=Araneus ventricosus TaxID=182803 RepID=A0A4Y2IZ29_ARAVE|nr:hypothetical protein AVEN_5521-1 [Araneus ventricosus]
MPLTFNIAVRIGRLKPLEAVLFQRYPSHDPKSQNSSHPCSSSATRGISGFISTSTRGPNVGRSFVFPLPSHRGPKLESANGVLEFEFFGIPLLPTKFHRFSTLKKGFPFSRSKTRPMEHQ